MYLLPYEKINIDTNCAEKIISYLILSRYGVPVLKSVFLSKEDLEEWNSLKQSRICEHLRSEYTMLRYLYRDSCSNVKNGGAIVKVDKENILSELPDNADAWLLEPLERHENRCCFNISINRTEGVLDIEVLGAGFDIFDLNKGYVSAHERISMPFPLEEGLYGEWWKWLKIDICTDKEYADTVQIRNARLKSYGYDVVLPLTFKPLDVTMIEKIRCYVNKIKPWFMDNRYEFVNVSCSVLKSGRLVFWDIQTPEGKMKAYL